MIDRNNYESYFLDFIEGNLNEEQINQILDFLVQNPDLKHELEMFSDVRIDSCNLVYSDKNELYKSHLYNEDITGNKAIAYFENDLNDDEKRLFEEQLYNSTELLTEQALYGKTKLIPDLNIKFNAKNKLIRKPKYIVIAAWFTKVAAAILVLFAINSLINNQQFEKLTISENQLIDNKKENSSSYTEPAKSNVSAEVKNDKQVLEPVEKVVRPTIDQNLVASINDDSLIQSREYAELSQIKPVFAQLQVENRINKLAKMNYLETETYIDNKPVITLEEFLANKAKKTVQEGLNTAQRLAQLGLNVASEISGERIGYSTEQGKIVSIDFEHKLLAFSIPIKKNQ